MAGFLFRKLHYFEMTVTLNYSAFKQTEPIMTIILRASILRLRCNQEAAESPGWEALLKPASVSSLNERK